MIEWEEARKGLFSAEEIEESNLRVKRLVGRDKWVKLCDVSWPPWIEETVPEEEYSLPSELLGAVKNQGGKE